jgi:hypothetical protein
MPSNTRKSTSDPLYHTELNIRNSSFASDFYDEIAGYIPGYISSSGRGDFNAKITLPDGAGVTKAVLSMNGAEMQDNVDYSMSSAHYLTPPCRIMGKLADNRCWAILDQRHRWTDPDPPRQSWELSIDDIR